MGTKKSRQVFWIRQSQYLHKNISSCRAAIRLRQSKAIMQSNVANLLMTNQNKPLSHKISY